MPAIPVIDENKLFGGFAWFVDGGGDFERRVG
jgi:hypothetical protein